MREIKTFYIGGRWEAPVSGDALDVVNPATEAVTGRVANGRAEDVDRAVQAATCAFPEWSASSREDRLALLERIIAAYESRSADLAAALTEEMGAPKGLAESAQIPVGRGHLANARRVLKTFVFEEERGPTRIVREPIGVCAMITPWNWPLNQITCKVAPAIAVGCTMVLKPSEMAPFTAQIFAEIMASAGAPAGVFNMVHGDGQNVGVPLSSHPGVDMVSFTGSTRAGAEVARNAAAGIKRVTQELGGKSPAIILDDEHLGSNVSRAVSALMMNSGQSCNAPSRILVPAARVAEAAEAASTAAAKITIGDPTERVRMGPVVSRNQYERIQTLIQVGIDEGAALVAGGVGRPDGISKGYFVRPTVFAQVDNRMRIAREEVFGPVAVLIAYDTLEDAVTIANDTDYGLAAYVYGDDLATARGVAARLRAGQVSINGASDLNAPFGGFKKSGNGREWGEFGFDDYLETKAILGYSLDAA